MPKATNSKSKSCSQLRCAICKRTFSQSKRFDWQMKFAHNNKQIRRLACNKCNNKYDRKIELDDHYARNHLGVLRYACEYCGEEFAERRTYFQHRKEQHPEEYEKLARTKYAYRIISFNKFDLGNHLNEILTSENLRKRSCVMCIKIFPTKNQLQLHMESLHLTPEMFDCKLCDRTFYVKADWELHLAEMHAGKPWFWCEICGKNFDSKREYCLHHKRRHPEEYVKLMLQKSCDQLYEIDGYVIVERVSLQDELSNIRDSNEAQNVVIIDEESMDIDDEILCSSNALAEKQRLYVAKTKKYVCQICQKQTIHKTLFVLHQMNAHKIFDSSWCSKIKNSDNPSVPEFKFHCSVCGYWFRYKHHHLYHECDISKVQNTGNDTPQKCKCCSKAFKHKKNLHEHLRNVHQQTSEHKCKICNKNFKSGRNLEDHMFSAHYNKPLYRCTLCGKTSANNSSSFIHRKKFHSEELERAEKPLRAYAFIEKLNK
ncbi:zinc finger protein 888-like [Uranotaenia lowii]|uniref:zinc finger protein 888-like n=1 Tax=Uranotaenia lowii TaxID=190385 RepID=UPI00247A6DEB|nr:zinc finger protein 888-like [Uranotaenia lowii]